MVPTTGRTSQFWQQHDAFENPWTGSFADDQAYRYFKIVFDSSKGGSKYASEIQLFGHLTITYPAGVEYGNQKPNAYLGDIPETVTFEKQDSTVNLEALLLNQTVRGTSFAELLDADFVDPDFEADTAALLATIKNSTDTMFDSLDLSKDGTYHVTFTSYETIELNGEVLGETTIIVGNGGEDPVEPVNKSALESLVETAEAIDRSKFTEETVKALDEALNNAKAVLADENATQEDVNAAYAALEAALNGLAEKEAPINPPDTGDYGSFYPIILILIAAGAVLVVIRKRFAK